MSHRNTPKSWGGGFLIVIHQGHANPGQSLSAILSAILSAKAAAATVEAATATAESPIKVVLPAQSGGCRINYIHKPPVPRRFGKFALSSCITIANLIRESSCQ